MSGVYTPEFFQHLQSNLNEFTPENSSSTENLKSKVSREDLEKEYEKYNDYYFQLLICDDPEKKDFKLVYGKRKDLIDKYKLDYFSLPTSGVEVDPSFVPLYTGKTKLDEIHNAPYATVRFLLQSRKLSQITASTWLKELTTKQKLIKKIFDTYNNKPDTYLLSSDLELEPENKENSSIKDIKKKEPYLIKPDSLSYNAISLVLLLSGQAYYKDTEDKYKLIGESIFSTYEMIWEYALDLSWDTFYARREDISHAESHPNPPFCKVILAYPPNPFRGDNDSQKKLDSWVTAEDEGAEYPFYPQKGSLEWKDHQLKYIVPPYPYIPLSSM